MKKAYQDGGVFYDSETNDVVAIYSLRIKDYHLKGAKYAREWFLENYKEYEME